MFERPYHRHTVTHPNSAQRVGRKTICDGCDKVKPDCLWVRREGGSRVCLCAKCRQAPWAKDRIEHADEAFKDVAL